MPTPLEIAETMLGKYAKGMGIHGHITLRTDPITRSVLGTYHGTGPAIVRSFVLPIDGDELGDLTVEVLEWVRGEIGLPTLNPPQKEIN